MLGTSEQSFQSEISDNPVSPLSILAGGSAHHEIYWVNLIFDRILQEAKCGIAIPKPSQQPASANLRRVCS